MQLSVPPPIGTGTSDASGRLRQAVSNACDPLAAPPSALANSAKGTTASGRLEAPASPRALAVGLRSVLAALPGLVPDRSATRSRASCLMRSIEAVGRPVVVF